MTATYKTGTVATTAASAVVTGTGTAWLVAAVAGGMFSCQGLSVPILSVDSDTQITLDYVWPGTTGSGRVYSILRENSDAADIIDFYDKLSQLLVTLSIAGIHPDNSGTIAKRNALTLVAADDNYLYLHAELGVGFAFYRWDGPSLSWIGPFPVATAVSGAGVNSIAAGTGITVDATNPAIPSVRLADMVASRVKGRITSTGVPQDLTLTQVLDMVGSAAEGDILYRTSSAWARLAKGAALRTLRQNSALTAPEWSPYAPREVLTAARTYYVRTDGSDSNDGLANTAGGAFLTVQKAFDVICGTLDLGGYDVTITVGAGTFTGPVLTKPVVGGNVSLGGAGVTTIVTSTGGAAIQIASAQTCVLTVGSMKITGTGGATSGIRLDAASKVTLAAGLEFGACTGRHMLATAPGSFISGGSVNYTISGGASAHYEAGFNAFIRSDGGTLTLTGTPAFSTAFAVATNGGNMLLGGKTFSGSATGTRHSASTGGGINTSGGGATYFPGNSAGSVADASAWYV